MRVVTIALASERTALTQSLQLPWFDPGQIEDHRADEHLCVLGKDGEVRAHCSLWWRQTPALPGHRTGAIGHYASADDEAAAPLLDAAVARLREHGCTLAIGPMDGNTWRRYRFVTGDDSAQTQEPAFFLEPVNPPEWPRQGWKLS